MPDVYLLQVSDAKELLEDNGFANVSVFRESGDWNDSTEASDDCQVVSQDPPAGETADFDEQIRLGYYRLYYHNTVCE